MHDYLAPFYSKGGGGMKRNPLVLFITMILLIQPFVFIAVGPFTQTALRNDAESEYLVAQGTRLDPSETTNHVPILINGTSDFVSQDWPGSGTFASPYVLSGLNITYAIGLVSIEVMNTDAYFVIRDCYIDQGSSLFGIKLTDTSHATIEYTTVLSVGGGISCVNANNTLISHSLVNSGNSYALYMTLSEDCTVERNDIMANAFFCAEIVICPGLSTFYNTFTAPTSNLNVNIAYSNNTRMTRDTLIDGSIGLEVFHNHFFEAYRINVDSFTIGIEVDQSPGASFIGCNVYAQVSTGIIIVSSYDSRIVDTRIEAPNDFGVMIINSNNTACTGNVLEDVWVYGILLASSHSSNVSDNTLTNINDLGIYVGDSNDVTVSFNTLENIADEGIYVTTSHRPILAYNALTNIGLSGFYIESSDNGTLTDCTIEETGVDGIEIRVCSNWEIGRNTITNIGNRGINIDSGGSSDVHHNVITDASDDGIYVSNHPVFEAWENTITDADSGIETSNCDSPFIRDNIISECTHGLWISSSDDADIWRNTISDIANIGALSMFSDDSIFHENSISDCERGIQMSWTQNNTFTDNILERCGFFMQALSGSLIYYNHTFSGNTVNGLPVYYAINEFGGSIAGTSYGEFLLVNCTGHQIIGGSFETSVTVQMFMSNLIEVHDVTSINNYLAFLIYYTHNVTMSGITVTDAVIGAYSLPYSNFLTVDDFTIHSDQGYAFAMNDAHYGTFTNGDIEVPGTTIVATTCTNVTIVDTTFRNGGATGIFAQSASHGWTITGCLFSNYLTGLSISSSDEWKIEDNYFEHFTARAFTALSMDDCEFIGNEVYHSAVESLYVSSGSNWLIRNNTFLWNDDIGLYLLNSPGAQVYYNIIGLSGNVNGWDDVAQFWDDGVDTGNAWDDYIGSGTYSINAATDRYPSQFLPTEPIIDNPLDVYYAEFSTGNEVTWNPFDNFLSDWEVEIDGGLWAADAWDFSDITVNIDGLSYGTHTMTVTVWDVDDNSISDTVMIHVFDDIAPIISHPPNTEAFEDGREQVITWIVSDLHPGSYFVEQDGVEVTTGTWVSGEVTANIDDLLVGTYVFTMIVADLDDNRASDSVVVVVFDDDTTPTIDSPEDILYTVGTIGNHITWNASDNYPADFEIVENNSVVESGSWSGVLIVYDVDGLEAGNYTFTITVFDGSEHSVSDSVNVQVVPHGWTPVQPIDPMLLLIVGAAIAGVVVAVAAVFFIRKRRAGSYKPTE
jgi:parallel beta-helix repeat protein